MKITLAIESAISGGSISLLRGDTEVANWIGTSNVSKAEDLLFNIDALLTANNISRQEIDLIAVSAGPGSFTGIRIGLATALGLKAGLGIEMSSESALKAMAFLQPPGAKIITAVPMGRSAVCLQSFTKDQGEVTALDEPHTLTEDALIALIHDEVDTAVILHSAMFEKVGRMHSVTDFGTNMAYAIGTICNKTDSVITEPLFISKSF